jgi:hypothetical protein
VSLGHEPDTAAQSLSGGPSRTIALGFLADDLWALPQLTKPKHHFYPQRTRGGGDPGGPGPDPALGWSTEGSDRSAQDLLAAHPDVTAIVAESVTLGGQILFTVDAVAGRRWRRGEPHLLVLPGRPQLPLRHQRHHTHTSSASAACRLSP